MKFLLILSIWSQCQVLTLQTSITTTANVGLKSFESLNPVKSLGNANSGALEICRKTFAEGNIDPASHYIHDGCTVTCLIGIDVWHKLPNQIGNPCPFNVHGTCDTDGRCHNEGPVILGQLDIDLWNGCLLDISPEEQHYFLVAHIRNSSEPWPLASMDYADSAAHCVTRANPGPFTVWAEPCDLASYLFKDTSRLFLYVYAHKKDDHFNNVLVGSTSATIFEIVQSQDYGSTWAFFKLEPTPAVIVLNFTFTAIQPK